MKVRGIEGASLIFRSVQWKSLSVFTLIAWLLFGSTFIVDSQSLPDKKQKDFYEKLNRQGTKAIRGGKYEEAIKLFKNVIGQDASNPQAHLGLSLAYLKLQDYVLCFDHASIVIKAEQNIARAYSLAGIALLRSGFVDNAVAALNRALELDKKDALAFGAAAEVDYYEGRAKESRLKALYAYSLDPEEPDYLITVARSSSRLEMFSDAAEAYQRFLLIAPLNDAERRDRIRGLIDFYRQLAGVQVHQVTGPAIADTPFQLGTDRRPYLTVKLNGREAKFVIDTGSGFTVISKDAAKKFGVAAIARGGTSQGVGGNGKFPIVYGLIRSFEIGDMKIRSIPCFIRPFHGSVERPEDERAEGFIGLSILAHFITEIDYKDKLVRLNRNLEETPVSNPSENMTVVPFRTTQNGLISVETELEGAHRINAILDSGASSTVISKAAVTRLNMREQIIKGQSARVIGAAGITDNVELVFIRNCRVADLEQTNIRALVLDFAAINETSGFEQSGILGGDFLRNFRITIDFGRGRVGFQPHSALVTKK
jgi:predicted aspartyl protease/Tfp pilus assembly protein PilF